MMSDLDGGDFSDVDDFDDLDMIMQQVQSEQQREEEAERVRHRKYIYRKRLDAEARLMADYFGIENYIQTHHPLPPHFDFFRVRPDATGLPGSSIIMKCTCAIRQLAYGVTPDSLDVYLQIGMLGSINYMHWAWRNCLKAWHGLFARGDKRYPTIMLETVASYDLWIWHAFFGLAGVNNDLTVLNNSPLFDDLLDDIALVALFEWSSKKMKEKTIDATDRITLLPDFIGHYILSFLLDDPKSCVRMSRV
nr:hypothetical protein [Tanacetum cinerariifolium]